MFATDLAHDDDDYDDQVTPSSLDNFKRKKGKKGKGVGGAVLSAPKITQKQCKLLFTFS